MFTRLPQLGGLMIVEFTNVKGFLKKAKFFKGKALISHDDINRFVRTTRSLDCIGICHVGYQSTKRPFYSADNISSFRIKTIYSPNINKNGRVYTKCRLR